MTRQHEQQSDAVRIVVYRWAGQWGPFKVSIPCGECALTRDVIDDTLSKELAGVAVEVEVRDWLSHWWEPLLKGGWHAPIVMVEGRVVSQGQALNRGLLTEAVIEAAAKRVPLAGNHVFGKAGCPHCVRARQQLDAAGVGYRYHDVVGDPRAMYEMLARVKPIIGPKTPVTVPQVWIYGEYVGGAEQLSRTSPRPAVDPTPDLSQAPAAC